MLWREKHGCESGGSKMRRTSHRRMGPPILAALLAVVAAIALTDFWFSRPVIGASEDHRLDKQIELWIAELSELDGYERWKTADWSKHPLGAGMHGWVVLVKDKGEELGYLVIIAHEDQTYSLLEFGSGPYPLYGGHSSSPLTGTEQQPLLEPAERQPIRLYLGPLQSYWLMERGGRWSWHDAKTGEEYPAPEESGFPYSILTAPPFPDERWREAAIRSLAIVRSATTEAFDPFERLSWLTSEPMDAEDRSMMGDTIHQALRDGRRIVYVTEIADGLVTLPLAVTGVFRTADGDDLVRLEQDGPRTFALGALAQLGRFYIMD
jgi:hypothetical protein